MALQSPSQSTLMVLLQALSFLDRQQAENPRSP